MLGDGGERGMGSKASLWCWRTGVCVVGGYCFKADNILTYSLSIATQSIEIHKREKILGLSKPRQKGGSKTQLRAPRWGYGPEKPVTVNRAPATLWRCQTGGPLLAHSQSLQSLTRQSEFAVFSFPAPCVSRACLSFSSQVSWAAALCTSPPC